MDLDLLKQAGERLASWPRTMILSHIRPDGDATGAMAALKQVIESASRQATTFIQDEVPPRYQFSDGIHEVQPWPADMTELEGQFDGVLIVDTCSWNQLGLAADYLKSNTLPKIILDHHNTHDDLSGRDSDDLYVIDSSASSTCLIVHTLCAVMGWPLHPAAAEALFAGMVTDTGWFRFSNTDGPTLRAAGALIEGGVRPDQIYARLYESHAPARLRLRSQALNTLKFQAEGAIAIMWLSKEMFDLAEATPGDSEELVNEPMSTASVAVSILLSELGDGIVRINFRSKSPEVCGLDVDVSAIAQQFGGGGHRRAAGARIPGSLDKVREEIISTVVAALQNKSSQANQGEACTG